MSDAIDRIEELKSRTKGLAIQVIQLFKELPKTGEARIIGKQLVRSATSVGSNYRAVARHKSNADKLNKLKIVLEEADETEYWLDILIETNIMEPGKLKPLQNEYLEIVKMISTSIQIIKNRSQ